MNSAIYRRLAVMNLKNNRQTYLPYIFISALMVMMYYIMDALSVNKSIGERNMQLILRYAVAVIVIFSVIFLFYTNSFLIKRRKKEIGTYNILGMGKPHLAKMLALENLITSFLSIAAGLVCGLLFSKLMWLVLLKLLHYDVKMNFSVSQEAMIRTFLIFAGIFAATLVYNLLQIRLANPAELLRGGREGEKEPKTKKLMTAFGVLAIGAGYTIANVTKEPLDALGNFFIAVVCVVLGTYALFAAGSIALLKILRKNKKFYYKTKHFTAVSGMLYRMKQNAAGLANICILSTMVLVILSTTTALYVGMEDVLAERFPHEFLITDYDYLENPEREAQIRSVIDEETENAGVSVKDMSAYHYGYTVAVIKGNVFRTKEKDPDGSSYSDSNVYALYLLTQEDYNALEGEHISLADDEVILYNAHKGSPAMTEDTIELDGERYRVAGELDTMTLEKKNDSSTVKNYYMIFSDEAKINKDAVAFTTGFDLNGTKADCLAAMEGMESRLNKLANVHCEGRELSRENFYNLYGSLFFIGIYLGLIFLVATVLIIYYKQISEGYDDRERYQIMQKVGMSKTEVKRSIRSQVLLVFFLPLIAAVIHVAAAFKVITKLLAVLNLVNVPLFFTSTVITIAVFAVFYGIVFAATAREYYKIVG